MDLPKQFDLSPTVDPAAPPYPAAPQGWLRSCSGNPADPGSFVLASELHAYVVNMVMAEIRNAIIGAGIDPELIDWNQLYLAIQAIALARIKAALLAGELDAELIAALAGGVIQEVFSQVFAALVATPLVVRPGGVLPEFPSIATALDSIKSTPFPIGARAKIDIAGTFSADPGARITVPCEIRASGPTSIVCGSTAFLVEGARVVFDGISISSSGAARTLTADLGAVVDLIGCALAATGDVSGVSSARNSFMQLTNTSVSADGYSLYAESGGFISLVRGGGAETSLTSGLGMRATMGGRINSIAGGPAPMTLTLAGSGAMTADMASMIGLRATEEQIVYAGVAPAPTASTGSVVEIA